MTHPMNDNVEASGGGNRRLLLGLGALAALLLAGFLIWYFVFRDDSAVSVTSDEAAEARQEALDEVTDGGTEALESSDLAGTWTVDTTVGTFGDACLTEVCDATFVGFRIDEELASIGAKTVVGRTPGVEGSLVIDGTAITAVDIVVDMTGLITDSNARNNAIRNQAIETASFPEASFRLTEPIELGELPAPGVEVAVEATGDLTVHGVTRTETIALTAELVGDRVVVVGQLGPMLLSDYDIDAPSAAVVVSVEDNATMELQLFFAKG